MATVKFWQGMDKASNIIGADKMMIGKNETGEAQYVDFQDANQFLSVQGIEMKPVPAGSLPAGPSGETRTMEILEAGTWTYGGNSFVNPSGSIMKLWWDGTTWSLGSSVALPVQDLSDYPTQEDVDTQASDLFEKSEADLFPSANLTVRRYTSDTGITDPLTGVSQTYVPEVGDKINIPVSGSANNTFWVNLGKTFTSGTEYTITTKLNTANSGTWSVGFGYVKANGDYFGWIISQAGIIRTLNKFTQSASLGVANVIPVIGDTVKIVVNELSVVFYVNNVNVFSLPNTESDIAGKSLKFVMRGFIENTFSYSSLSSPIKAYVNLKLSDNTNSPEGFYRYVAASKKWFVFTKMNSNTYAGAEIIYEYNMSEIMYQDYWRLGATYPYLLGADGSLTKQTELLLAGSENECALKKASSKEDFAGGYHGNELVTSIEFFANGVKISWDKDNDIALTECNDFYYLEKSTLHDHPDKGNIPVPGHPKIADHIKITSIHKGGYDCFNRLIWNYNGQMQLWYTGLSCIGKGCATNYRIESNFENRIADGTTGMYPNETGFVGYSKVNYWASKYSSSVDSEVTKGFDNLLCAVKVNDRSLISPNDTKYYRSSPPRTVSVGEIYESKITVRFNVK
ncbi:hypothetical protein [Sphingobacterium sp.]|uniref:hypothetical protein n=1 Tax=Sphingobacterium sp. TaxID=341027 RepID=UPI0028A91688|nr:hypothetical protein [Sphingobacterium sp.]